MKKTIFSARMLSVLIGATWMASAWSAPPVDNTVPPCDHAGTSKKPACNMDSESVKMPPKMPHERGVIVPPEVPAEGLPNQDKRRQEGVPPRPQPPNVAPSSPGNELKN